MKTMSTLFILYSFNLTIVIIGDILIYNLQINII